MDRAYIILNSEFELPVTQTIERSITSLYDATLGGAKCPLFPTQSHIHVLQGGTLMLDII